MEQWGKEQLCCSVECSEKQSIVLFCRVVLLVRTSERASRRVYLQEVLDKVRKLHQNTNT
jgi:hypothetical protein